MNNQDDGSYYFKVDSFPNYGRLARLDFENMQVLICPAQVAAGILIAALVAAGILLAALLLIVLNAQGVLVNVLLARIMPLLWLPALLMLVPHIQCWH